MVEKQSVLIGWAARDITPDKPVSLLGQFHLRISQGVKDPVTVTALCVTSEEDAFIWVSCDLGFVPATVLAKCRAKLKVSLPEFPSEKLVTNATHTHTAPDPFGFWYPPTPPGVMTPEDYGEFLAGRMAEAAAESWKARKPGAVSWGSGYAITSHNRRAVYADDLSKRSDFFPMPGTKTEKNARMYGDTSDLKFLNFEGSEDPRINILYTFDANHVLTGAVINQSCPSQVEEQANVISADFWHEVRLELKKRHGEHLYVLPQCSTAGDLAPHVQYDRESEHRMLTLKQRTLRQDVAIRIATAFDDILGWVKTDIRREVVLKHCSRMINLPRRLISEEEYKAAQADLATLNGIPAAGGDTPYLDRADVVFARTVRVRKVISRYQEQGAQPELPVELHVIRVGDVVLATNTFELFLDYGIRMMARSPAVQTFLVQLAGGGDGSYLPTQKAQEGESYSACLYCNTVSPEGGQKLVEETVKSMNDLWK